MKKLFVTLLVLTLSLANLASSQSQGETGDRAENVQGNAQARDMYLTYANNSGKKTRKRAGRPGARVRIELRRDGVTRFVPVDTTFRAGDKVKFHFAVNFPAHISVTNLGSSGRLNSLFPYEGAPEVVAATKNYSIPHRSDLWFEFDNTPGTERLTFVFSAVRLTASSGTVNPNSDRQAELGDLNSQALANSKDLHIVQVSSDESYVLCDEQRLRKPVGFQIILKHR
jgi:hypothetical protein